MLALCIQIARKLRHVYSPDIPSSQLLEGKLKRLPYRAVPLCSGQSGLASMCRFVQFNNQLDV